MGGMGVLIGPGRTEGPTTPCWGWSRPKAGARRPSPDWPTGSMRPARHFPIEQLGVSPQCGFATSVIGNAIGIDDQRRKLRIVAETARALWP